MKNLLVIFLVAISLVSCKEYPEYSGDFLAVDGSAIFTIGNETYKVEMNDLCKELITKSKAFQKSPYDFVNVQVKGEISDNPNANEWKKIITISAIENVSKSETEENITVVK